MSSLRNAVKRITHKERSQPRARAHLGILEKHGDYKERAVDYHRKEDHIKRLRQKASQRNPDEFYFGMHKAQVKDGRHQATDKAKQDQFDASVGMDTIRLLKDQDLSYIRAQKQKDTKKMERLQASMHFLEKSSETKEQHKHTIFVESKEEAKDFDASKHFDTMPELLDRSFNRPRLTALEQASEEVIPKTDAALKKEEKAARRTARKLAKARENAYREIQERADRARKLARAEAHLMTEKMVGGKGRKRKIKEAENGQPAQYKWRRKRLG